jgi:gamma-glutamyltranspeptidase/glutathione hydrolase
VVGEYRGLRIVSAAPPSSGGVLLVQMLNMLEALDWQGMAPLARQHHLIEVMRRAYRDRAEYLGDPDFVDMPLARLTSREYASRLVQGIDNTRATPSSTLHAAAVSEPATALDPYGSGAPAAMQEGRNTTHFSIIDAQGNRVAATLSINYPFGASYVPPGTGVLLNDEMDDFAAKPGVPNAYGLVGAEANAIVAGKRPLSSMSPTFVESADGVALLGTPGGSRIISMVLLGILDIAAGQHDPQHWVAAARLHHQYLPDRLQYEPGALSDASAEALSAMGHNLEALATPYGNMQAIYWDRRARRVSAASDPRGGGSARLVPALQP